MHVVHRRCGCCSSTCRSRTGCGAAASSATLGVLDFAGGTVVHLNAGIAGLVCCPGARQAPAATARENMAPHNLVLTVIGASLLWVGWFGFNAGSALSSGELARHAPCVDTHLAAAAAALAWMVARMGRAAASPRCSASCSGAVAGLGTITPAVGLRRAVGALVIGAGAGAACYWASVVLKNRLGYDDLARRLRRARHRRHRWARS